MKYLLTVAALLAATACADSTAPSALRPTSGSNDIFNTTEPSDLATVNPCNGDAVDLAGTVHTVITTQSSGSGNFTLHIDLTGQYSGVGIPSGLGYTGSTHFLKDLTINAPVILSIYQDMDLRSQTGADNFTQKLQLRFVVNANGVPVVDVERDTETCKG